MSISTSGGVARDHASAWRRLVAVLAFFMSAFSWTQSCSAAGRRASAGRGDERRIRPRAPVFRRGAATVTMRRADEERHGERRG